MKKWKHNVISVLFCFFWLPGCWATCYKITAVNNTPSSASYTEPGKGEVVPWGGALDTAGSAGSIAGNVNLPDDSALGGNETFVPDGTILASGTVRFLEMGSIAYTPETILFRCTADENGKLYEYYSTNGDYAYGGNIEVGKNTGQSESYQTYVTQVASRITNLATGEYYSRYWKSRPLRNLDRDSYGWILIKAKNFSDAKIELFKNSNAKGVIPSGNYSYHQPLAYIAFKGGGLSSKLYDGADHASNFDGWYSYWPGAVNLYNRVSFTTILTCKLTQTTPSVIFPLISVQQLMQGQKITQPIDISFICQSTQSSGNYTGFQSGTFPGQTAIGFVVNSENAAAAREEGLESDPGIISHLLSDGYKKDPEAPTGVGVSISDGKQSARIDLLDDINAIEGWNPVLFNASVTGGVNGTRRYKARYYATLERLPGKQVTSGYFHATLQVVIKVM
ncbi:fimbrial protein [Pantoea osteomyelitidis]|uniref:Fimbrial protein n=1 Tax=Pantoea osteomyelitidis TaxID=3230026 RepID=A0ABW7PYY6_9GAMM